MVECQKFSARNFWNQRAPKAQDCSPTYSVSCPGLFWSTLTWLESHYLFFIHRSLYKRWARALTERSSLYSSPRRIVSERLNRINCLVTPREPCHHTESTDQRNDTPLRYGKRYAVYKTSGSDNAVLGQLKPVAQGFNQPRIFEIGKNLRPLNRHFLRRKQIRVQSIREL